jgi:hypothetical protein
MTTHTSFGPEQIVTNVGQSFVNFEIRINAHGFSAAADLS